VNRAIVRCHRAGIVTSATLMATGAQFDEAVPLAATMPNLSVGCHVVLVDGEPLLPPDEVRSLLVPGSNRFHNTIGEMLKALLGGGFRATEIEAEATAQFAKLRAAGISISHFDAHKHAHMFPAILRPLLRAAAAQGITAVRNPFEAAGMVGWIEAAGNRKLALRKAQTTVLRGLFRRQWLALVRAAGLATTDGSLGVAATGALDEARLRQMLDRMPEGTWELVCHPGYNDAELQTIRTRLRESREIELGALTALTPDELRTRYGIELASFTAISQAQRAVTI
jgi:predicted glycoside hydrolase/deacetylase ChbG (UPF0249 family)